MIRGQDVLGGPAPRDAPAGQPDRGIGQSADGVGIVGHHDGGDSLRLQLLEPSDAQRLEGRVADAQASSTSMMSTGIWTATPNPKSIFIPSE